MLKEQTMSETFFGIHLSAQCFGIIDAWYHFMMLKYILCEVKGYYDDIYCDFGGYLL